MDARGLFHGFEVEHPENADAQPVHVAVLQQGQAEDQPAYAAEQDDEQAVPVPGVAAVAMGMTTRMHQTITDAAGNEWIKHQPSRNGAKQYWRCRAHRSGCAVRGWSNAGSSEIHKFDGTEHTCNASPAAQRLRQLQSQIRARAFVEKNSSNAAIVDNITRGVPDDVAQRFKRHNLLRIANKAKSADGASKVNRLPPDIEWTDAFVRTATGDRFLLYDSRLAEHDKPIFFIWASPTGLNQLRTHRNWASDGTFFAAPKHFDSLYTVHVVNDDHSAVCCAYILLPDRKKETYIRALCALIGEAQLWDAAPASIITDFEAAAIKAWQEIFPVALSRGCYFHLGQAFWRSIASLGLAVLYRSNDVARLLLRSFLALAAVHPDHVVAAFNLLVAAIEAAIANGEIDAVHRDAIADFCTYVRDNYIRRLGRQGQWLAPRVADIRVWNCYHAILQGRHRTNNGTEAWNRQFGDMFTRSDCAMDKFVYRMQTDEDRTRQALARQGEVYIAQEIYPGEPLRRGRRPEQVAADAALQNLAERYVDVYGLARCMDYMRAVQYHLSKPRFPGEVDEEVQDDGADAVGALMQGDEYDDDEGALIRAVPLAVPGTA
ncbi:hypothetical protein AAVH_06370 [Aphelenchoides avenae]|nr:hypothetical protein AAVH_06370 [Aphelenchus avenae]